MDFSSLAANSQRLVLFLVFFKDELWQIMQRIFPKST